MITKPVAFRVGDRQFSSMFAAGLYASEMRLTVEPIYLEEAGNSIHPIGASIKGE